MDHHRSKCGSSPDVDAIEPLQSLRESLLKAGLSLRRDRFLSSDLCLDLRNAHRNLLEPLETLAIIVVLFCEPAPDLWVSLFLAQRKEMSLSHEHQLGVASQSQVCKGAAVLQLFPLQNQLEITRYKSFA